MNRLYILTLLLTCFAPAVSMEIDSDTEPIIQAEVSDITHNPRQIYERDMPDIKSEDNSCYTYPMDGTLFRSQEMGKKLEAINDYLELQHIRITIEETPSKIIATLNQIAPDHINSGRETLLPFHTIEIAVGENTLPGTINKKLIEKRLQKIKDLAIQLHGLKTKKLDQDIKDFKKNTPFTQKFLFVAQHRIKPALEDSIAHHTADTLALPLIKGIETLKELATGISPQEQELIQLINSINREEIFLKNWIAVKRSQKKLTQPLSSTSESKTTQTIFEENFIRNFETATQH